LNAAPRRRARRPESDSRRPRFGLFDEMWRVVRPGGQIVVKNHFAAARAWVEAAMEKSAGWLGSGVAS